MGLDLESVKDQVSSMRNLVKQSKNHLINKLTREAKKLREKKGTAEQKMKNEKKADRFIQEVMLMKKVHPDEVSKFVLKTEDCEKVISKPETPLEIKVLARFGTYKLLSPIISKFHADEPTWKEDLEDLVKQLVIEPKHAMPARKKSLNSSIVKTAGNNVFSVTPVKQSVDKTQNNSKLNKINGAKIDKVQKKKETRNSPSISTKSPVAMNKSKLSKPNVEVDLKRRKSPSDSSSNSEEESEDSDKEIYSKAFKRQKQDVSDSEDDTVDEESSEDSSEISEEDMFPSKFAKNPSKKAKILNSKEEVTVGKIHERQKNQVEILDSNITAGGKTNILEGVSPKRKESRLNEELDEIEKRLGRKKGPKPVEEPEEIPEESVDPFFVTPDGEEYISSAPIPKNEDKPPVTNFQSSSTPKEFYRKGKKITPSFQGHQRNFDHQNRNNSFNRNDKRDSFNRNHRGNSFNRGNSNSYNRNENRSFNRNDNNSFNRNDNNSFNRNENRSFNRNENRSFNRNDNNSFNRNENNSFNRNDRRESFSRNDNYRGRNSSSFGNKRSFDNNDRKSSFGNNFNGKNQFGSNRNDSKFNSRKQDSGNNEHLHPSWEAKKKQSTLAPFQGIKTVFNE